MSARTPFRPRSLALCAVVLLAAIGARPARAQDGVSLRISPLVGSLDPRGSVPHAPILDAAANVVSYGDFGPAWAFGAAVEAVPSRAPLSLRASLTHSPGGSKTGLWGCAPLPDGEPTPCPAILIPVPTDIDVTAGALDVVGSLAAGPVELRPLAGIGWIRYAYEWDGADVGSFSLAPGSATRNATALHLGVAARVSVRGLRIGTEYGEYLSRSEPRPTTPDRLGVWTVSVELPTGG